MKSTEDLENQLRNVIGYIGLGKTIELLATIAESYADVRAKNGMAVGSSASAAAGLHSLAEQFEAERSFEYQQLDDSEDSGKRDYPY